MALQHQFITNRRAAKQRKKLFKYSTTDADGKPLDGYVKAGSQRLAIWIIHSKNPGCGEVTVKEVKPKNGSMV